MQNEEIAKITQPFYYKSAPEAAANALVKEAHKRWKIVRVLMIYKSNLLTGRRSD